MENIQVALRIRPINEKELDANEIEIWSTTNNSTVTITSDKYNELVMRKRISPSQKHTFNYNYCFDKAFNTKSIYRQLVKRIALSSLQGINGTIFMYGQTGSGKTFTMMGQYAHLLGGNNNPLPSNSNTHSVNSSTLSKQSPRVSLRSNQIFPLRSREYSAQHFEKEIKNLNQTPEKVFGFQTINPLKDKAFLHQKDLFGEDNEWGILVLSLKDIFNEIEKQSDKRFYLRCSYIEIYTEAVYDLLKPQEKMIETLTINEDMGKEFYIKGATEEIVNSIDEIMEKIKFGEANRHYAQTTMNHSSSRSHTIFRLYVQSMAALFDENNNIITQSILNFVDLAGSERISIHDQLRKSKPAEKTIGLFASNGKNNEGMMLKDRVNESKHINKSLFFLTQVISLKSEGKSDVHIPYRNSPLTKILRSSLGGNSRTAIILCINPCLSEFDHSISTLRFGSNAIKIENNVKANLVSPENDEAIKKLLDEYEKKILDMKKDTKNISDIYQKQIEDLQEQKKLLAKLLENAKHNAFTFASNNNVKDLLKNNKNGELNWDHFHMANIGIVHVLVNKAENIDTQLRFDVEGEYALKGLSDLQKHYREQEMQLHITREKLSLSEASKLESLKREEELIRELACKREELELLKSRLSAVSSSNEQHQNLLQMYQNKNNSLLTSLPDNHLSVLESSLLTLINTIKTEKSLRTLFDGMRAVMVKEDASANNGAMFKNFLAIKQNMTANPAPSSPDISNLFNILAQEKVTDEKKVKTESAKVNEFKLSVDPLAFKISEEITDRKLIPHIQSVQDSVCGSFANELNQVEQQQRVHVNISQNPTQISRKNFDSFENYLTVAQNKENVPVTNNPPISNISTISKEETYSKAIEIEKKRASKLGNDPAAPLKNEEDKPGLKLYSPGKFNIKDFTTNYRQHIDDVLEKTKLNTSNISVETSQRSKPDKLNLSDFSTCSDVHRVQRELFPEQKYQSVADPKSDSSHLGSSGGHLLEFNSNKFVEDCLKEVTNKYLSGMNESKSVSGFGASGMNQRPESGTNARENKENYFTNGIYDERKNMVFKQPNEKIYQFITPTTSGNFGVKRPGGYVNYD